MKPAAWVRNLTDPQPHCVTDLKYMSAADTDAGAQYVPLYAAPEHSEQWWKHEVSNAYAEGYKKGYADAMGWKVQNHLEHLPQREWQGLTDEDIYSIIESNVPPKLTSLFETAEWVAKVVEAKLKEKNA